MKAASLGHWLFERWLIDTYGASTRSPGRPRYEGLNETRSLIAAELKKISPRLKPPKRTIGLYHWLASAQDGSRAVPRQHIRVALERITHGKVPADSWKESAPGSPLEDGGTEDPMAAAGA